MNEPLRILVKGLNWTGSGTVVDLLNEYKTVEQVPGGFIKIDPTGCKRLGEFNDFRKIGLVGDQIAAEKGNSHPSKLMEVVQQNKNRLKIVNQLRRMIKLTITGQPLEVLKNKELCDQLNQINLSLERLTLKFKKYSDLSKRLEIAQCWIGEIANTVGKDKRAIIFDQPINIGQHDDYWPIVFKPYKLIIVIRDPRDQFAERVKHGHFSKAFTAGIGHIYGWDWSSAVKFGVDMTMATMKAVDQLINKLGNENIMIISFEKMVLDYEESRQKIEDFVGLSSSEHIRPKKYFDPDWSSRNIGVYKNPEYQVPDYMLKDLISWYKKYQS